MTDTLGIDLGTGSIKVARFDADGEMVGGVARGYHEPAEHAAPFDRIWDALADATRELTAAAADRPPVVGIGLSSQVNSFALVDEHEDPITPVYLWTGDSAGDEADELQNRFTPAIIADVLGMTALTGQLLAPKCRHLRRREPRLWGRMSGIRQLPDLVCHRLCGVSASDASLWSLTGLLDAASQTWWAPILTELGLDQHHLPALASAQRSAGRLTPEAASALHLPAGIPIAPAALDHLAAAVGVGNVRPGGASLSTGTASCVVVTHTNRPPALKGGVVGRHPADPAHWYALTWSGLSSTGLNWYARQVGGEERLPELLAAAGDVPRGADGWRAIPRDPNRGDAGFDFTCSEPSTSGRPTDAQAMRAILECLCDEIRALLTRAAARQQVDRLIAMGGGARSDLWLQMLADRLGLPVTCPACLEASARGASRFAALVAGQIDSLRARGSDA